MNPLIKLFEKIHPNNEAPTFIIRSEFNSDKEYEAKMKIINDGINGATEEERVAFLEHNLKKNNS